MDKKAKNGKNDGSDVMKFAVVGATIAGVAAAAYFFLGPKGKQHQKHAKAWVIKMKGDIVEKLEMAKYINEPMYHEIVDTIATEYEKGKKATRREIQALAKDLKKHWKTIGGSPKAIKQELVKEVKKTAKKGVGETTKK